MQREFKFQHEADPDWARQVSRRPGCEGIFSCLQCGTCSGTCPLSIYMEYGPRRIIALVREGFRMDALRSRTIWLCASCYSCSVNCPRQIHITDIMYSLKREAIREKLYPARFPIPVLAHEFSRAIARRGRATEFWLVFRLALKTRPLGLIRMLRNGWDLVRTGRLVLKRDRVRNPELLASQLTWREVA